MEDDPNTEAEVEDVMDNNDTMTNLNQTDKTFEEWVSQELSFFHIGAITNLKVGFVNNDSFEVGTWYMNRWSANNIGTNNNIKRDSLVSSHMIMCDWGPNNNNVKNYGPIKANSYQG